MKKLKETEKSKIERISKLLTSDKKKFSSGDLNSIVTDNYQVLYNLVFNEPNTVKIPVFKEVCKTLIDEFLVHFRNHKFTTATTSNGVYLICEKKVFPFSSALAEPLLNDVPFYGILESFLLDLPGKFDSLHPYPIDYAEKSMIDRIANSLIGKMLGKELSQIDKIFVKNKEEHNELPDIFGIKVHMRPKVLDKLCISMIDTYFFHHNIESDNYSSVTSNDEAFLLSYDRLFSISDALLLQAFGKASFYSQLQDFLDSLPIEIRRREKFIQLNLKLNN